MGFHQRPAGDQRKVLKHSKPAQGKAGPTVRQGSAPQVQFLSGDIHGPLTVHVKTRVLLREAALSFGICLFRGEAGRGDSK